jgi:phenylacetate-coenzyme A ligase PaaK-like adenylate-forming protein/N-dimethylarginine dimethylaminohydrolase
VTVTATAAERVASTPAIELAPAPPTLMVSALACTDHDVAEDCRYQVAWQINPHMEVGAVDFHRAVAEHEAFKAAIGRLGANVVELPFVHGAFDSVFAKDPALLVERRGVKRALLARLRFPERQREQAARADFYERQNFEVVCEPSGPSWEGGDVVMMPSGTSAFLGYGPRSRAEAAAWLERHADVPVHALELRDPHLYHLDMALAILPDGTALACAEAFMPDAMHALERARGIREVVPVPREDALAFGLNLVPIGDAIVCGARVPRVAAIVRARGYRVEVVPLDQFHLAGGSAACLVARLYPDVAPPAPSPAVPFRSRGSMDIYGPLFRSVLFPLWETRVRRRPVIERWQELRKTQWASLDELHAMQATALAKLTEHSYRNVPFYRAEFDRLGLTPSDVRAPGDLVKLPVLRREDLRRAGKDRESTAAPLVEIRKQTSGTTGEPLLFGFERDSENWRRAVKLRGYEWAGYLPGMRALHFWGAPLPTPPPWQRRAKVALDRMMNRDTYVQCAVMSEDKLRDVVAKIEHIAPQVLVVYAQAGAELARYINRNSLRTWQTIPVISGAEKLLPRDRADLEEAFGPAVFDTYGCREVMLIATECEVHHGMHVSMENLVVEIVVNDNGRQRLAREGESGEVVFTDLHNLAMPFIRYANGDIATQGPTRRCSCGRTLPRILSIQGRTSETLRDASGAAVSGLALSFLFHDIAGAIRQFQAVQHKDRSVTISIVLAEQLPPTTLEEIRKNGARLLVGCDVKVNVVPELPRNPAGKHNLVVVERD